MTTAPNADAVPLTERQTEEGWCCRTECCGPGSWCCAHANVGHRCVDPDDAWAPFRSPPAQIDSEAS